MGSLSDAKLLYSEACNLWPQFPPAQYGMAQMLVYEGSIEPAVRALDAVLAEVPDNQVKLPCLKCTGAPVEPLFMAKEATAEIMCGEGLLRKGPAFCKPVYFTRCGVHYPRGATRPFPYKVIDIIPQFCLSQTWNGGELGAQTGSMVLVVVSAVRTQFENNWA